jgi:NTE family protein
MKLGLALSGGGIRAAVFHLGVLRRLADEGLLENVEQLSTVSGGSLVIAATLAVTEMRWPSSAEFTALTYPALKHLLTTTDLFSFRAIGWTGLLRFNRRLIFDRARVLAELLERQWQVRGLVSEVPDRPTWWINTTCLETGKNWRFSKREMGDWQFGRHYTPQVRLAEAAAASAAVPYVIGTLKFDLPSEGWYRTDPATRKPLQRIATSDTVRLWDGGACGNLGLEPLYKPQQGSIGCEFLICSDASGPLGRYGAASVLGLLRGHLAAPRLFDIFSDQIRALQSRMLMASIEAGRTSGVLVRIGNSVRDIDIKSGRLRDAAEYGRFQADEETAVALRYPTDLKALAAETFDRVARHGYEVADATLTTHAASRFARSYHWGNSKPQSTTSQVVIEPMGSRPTLRHMTRR